MKDINKEIYKLWAPSDNHWTAWCKPVIFASIGATGSTAITIPSIAWLDVVKNNTIIIVDLPSDAGVLVGLGLAEMGYRPVPLYNGVNPKNDSSIVNSSGIEKIIASGTSFLRQMKILNNAPPAFLLDANRLKDKDLRGIKFDNRWSLFEQDLPSANYLLNNGIERIIVCIEGGTKIQEDLAKILNKYQKIGIKIFTTDGRTISPITIKKPSGFRMFSYRFFTIFGLRRNATGGFGGRAPDSYGSSGLG